MVDTIQLFQAIDMRSLSPAAVYRTCRLECRVNVERDKVAVPKASLLGRTYTVMCTVYCFVKT